MPRYKDTDEILKRLPNDLPYKASVKRVLIQAPDADVVPRAEVDELIGKLECLLCHATDGRLSKHTYDLRTMEAVVTDCANETYNDGFAEGAREILAEIEKKIADLEYQAKIPRKTVKVEELKAQMNWILHEVIPQIIAEIKEKYTEGKKGDEGE